MKKSVKSFVSAKLISAGDSEGSEGIWTRRSPILRGAGCEYHRMAVLLPGNHWSRLLRLITVLRDHHSRYDPRDRSPRRDDLQGEVPGRERCLARPLPLGTRFLLLRRDQAPQQQGCGSRSASPTSGERKRGATVSDRLRCCR